MRFLIFFVVWLCGCMSMQHMNRMVVTHVLAITEAGDTVNIPIDQIQPTKIYNVIGYDFYRPYHNSNSYYRDWRFYYDNYNMNNGGYNGVGLYGNIKSIHPTTYIGNGSNVQSYGGNTTGGGSNPVASNPVTDGGGSSRGKNN